MITARVRRKRHHALPKAGGPQRIKVGMVEGEADQDNIDKALWNEFGTESALGNVHIPERPFLRNAMAENRNKYRNAMRSLAKKIVRSDLSKDQAMGVLGAMGQGDVQRSITNLSDPPNDPRTIAEKGSSNPLIDTGEMRSAVTWKLEK